MDIRRLFLGLMVAGLAPAADAAEGPNIVNNPGFDANTFGWNVELPSGPVPFSTADAAGSPSSGSARLSMGPPGAINLIANGNCFLVTAGQIYVFGGAIWAAPLSAGDSANFFLTSYSGAGCTGSPVSSFSEPVTTPGWHRVAGLGGISSNKLSARLQLRTTRSVFATGTFVAYFDDLFVKTGTCAPSATQLCLNQGRFRVRAKWETGNAQGNGMTVPFSAESGSFWFFSPVNLELDVKVINACSLNNRYWVYAAGLTDVKVALTVVDTVASVTKTYDNPLNHTFTTITDSAAFATCP
ncbi:MAG TPA: hypothetical protein VGV61_09745 [Thermoanaerobaculia bacterium]|jgi:hypothetical protein|nr:hypothetical protein [Thermoanaerobaculia bacterium]